MDLDQPDDATLDFFSTWKVDALKLFLQKRCLWTNGTKAELAALCFSANKMNIPIQPDSADMLKTNEVAYNNLLQIDSFTSIPDPFSICEGWSSEKDALCFWPAVYMSDITTFFFFIKNCPDATTDRYLCQYKVGKAYEYFSSNWLKEVFSIQEFTLLFTTSELFTIHECDAYRS